jgi:hypothetical protein
VKKGMAFYVTKVIPFNQLYQIILSDAFKAEFKGHFPACIQQEFLMCLSAPAVITTNAHLTFCNTDYGIMYLRKFISMSCIFNFMRCIWECREILLPEMFNDTEYSIELKKAIIKVLTVICEKIKNSEVRKYGNPDNIIAEGIDFDLNGDVKSKIKLLADFL